jgi:hypothetical protein
MKFDEEKPEAYAWRMHIETRLEKIEEVVATMKLDIAFLKANSATKSDLAKLEAELKTSIAEAKSAIIIWVVGAVFIGQLLPQLLKQFFG